MSEEKREQKVENKAIEEPEICEDPLLCPEEWAEHPGEKVLGVYFKETLPISAVDEEADLESFEKYWGSKKEGNLSSEYHKEGAPHLSEPRFISEEKVAQVHEESPEEELKVKEQAKEEAIAEMAKSKEAPLEQATEKGKINRPIDIHTIEVISYAMVRALFSQGISIPLKKEGVMDMELTVKGKDIILDTKELFPIKVPELVVWRIIYAYKGKPVMELGRGVKKGMRLYRFRALVMLVDVWRGNRKQQKAVKKEGALAKGMGKAGSE